MNRIIHFIPHVNKENSFRNCKFENIFFCYCILFFQHAKNVRPQNNLKILRFRCRAPIALR